MCLCGILCSTYMHATPQYVSQCCLSPLFSTSIILIYEPHLNTHTYIYIYTHIHIWSTHSHITYTYHFLSVACSRDMCIPMTWDYEIVIRVQQLFFLLLSMNYFHALSLSLAHTHSSHSREHIQAFLSFVTSPSPSWLPFPSVQQTQIFQTHNFPLRQLQFHLCVQPAGYLSSCHTLTCPFLLQPSPCELAQPSCCLCLPFCTSHFFIQFLQSSLTVTRACSISSAALSPAIINYLQHCHQ